MMMTGRLGRLRDGGPAAAGVRRMLVTVTVTVVGSAGPIRFVASEEEPVATIISTALRCYAREGRFPALGCGEFHLFCARLNYMERMYHHHQGNNNSLASRTAFLPDRHPFMQGASIPQDIGLALSPDAKPRLKSTPELHERFTEAVNQLGEAQKATPKTIMRLMGKYRLSRNLQVQASQVPNKSGSTVFAERFPEISGPLTNGTNPFHTNPGLQINEALEMQIEVQRRLHEQLEVITCINKIIDSRKS
ncbi:hypothetical protein Taro_044027, partial [Colocasia esculenta]|nr:hypothetical protein [Colocasia esculenta]